MGHDLVVLHFAGPGAASKPGSTPSRSGLPLPLDAAFITADENFKRGYVQSWNLTLEKQLGNWVGSAGYVATRSIRQTAFLDANWSDLGTGNAGRQLVQKFDRNAATTFIGHLGTVKYDSLQARLQRRFRGGYQMQLSYTWGHSLGYTAENSTSAPRVNHPGYWHKNYGPTPQDVRHNVSGQRRDGIAVRQRQALGAERRRGSDPRRLADQRSLPAEHGDAGDAGGSGTTLNAPGSGQFADCLGPVAKIGERTRVVGSDEPGRPERGQSERGALRDMRHRRVARARPDQCRYGCLPPDPNH